MWAMWETSSNITAALSRTQLLRQLWLLLHEDTNRKWGIILSCFLIHDQNCSMEAKSHCNGSMYFCSAPGMTTCYILLYIPQLICSNSHDFKMQYTWKLCVCSMIPVEGTKFKIKEKTPGITFFFLAITADILFYLKYDQTCLIVLGIGTSKVPIVIVLNKVSYSEAKN